MGVYRGFSMIDYGGKGGVAMKEQPKVFQVFLSTGVFLYMFLYREDRWMRGWEVFSAYLLGGAY